MNRVFSRLLTRGLLGAMVGTTLMWRARGRRRARRGFRRPSLYSNLLPFGRRIGIGWMAKDFLAISRNLRRMVKAGHLLGRRLLR